MPCPNGCEGSDDAVLEGGDVLHGVPGRFRVVRCRRCGLARTNPRPTPEAIGRFYPADYAPYQTAGGTAPPNRRGLLQRLADRANGTSMPPLAPGAALEIGCATGSFLDRLKREGWRTSGVEVSPVAAAAAQQRGHDVWVGRVEATPLPSERPNLVCGWMVVEHLHDPVAALTRLHELSAPGAWLAISVPDFNAWGRRLLGEYWILVDVPRHLFHYTPATLDPLFARCGWTVERVAHSTTAGFAFESVARFAASRHRRGVARTAYDVASGARFNGLRRVLGVALGLTRQSGAMIVWARRRDAR